MKTTARKSKPTDALAPLRAKVQVLRRQVLALADDDVWRPFLAQHAGGETSTRVMAERQLLAVVEALHKAGAPRVDGRARFVPSAQAGKARALWKSLHEAGAIKDPSQKAFAAFVLRQTGQEMGAVSAAGWNRVLEGLKAIQRRHATPKGGRHGQAQEA